MESKLKQLYEFVSHPNLLNNYLLVFARLINNLKTFRHLRNLETITKPSFVY